MTTVSRKKKEKGIFSRREFLCSGIFGGVLTGIGIRSARAPGLTEWKSGVRFELGVASYTFREFGLEETIAMTRRLGLRQICLKDFHLPLDSPKEKIDAVIKKIKEADLIPYGCGVVYMRSAEDVERAFAYAATAEMETIVGVPNHELLGHAQRKVRETGIKLAIHNHGPGDKLYPTPQSAYALIKNLDTRIGLCLDIGHCQRSGLDPSQTADVCADRLLDIHFKDVTSPDRDGAPVEVGRGTIDVPKFVRTLVKLGYGGTAAFEYEKDGKDPFPGLAESVGYVRGILAAL